VAKLPAACSPSRSRFWPTKQPTKASASAGLVLEVKGDFCREIKDILRRHQRAEDYIEISLDSKYCYNPLHNDLDADLFDYGTVLLGQAGISHEHRHQIHTAISHRLGVCAGAFSDPWITPRFSSGTTSQTHTVQTIAKAAGHRESCLSNLASESECWRFGRVHWNEPN